MKNPRLSILLWTFFLILVNVSFAAALTPDPRIEAETALLLDMTTGEVLYEKSPDRKMYPASTTKMITCILALEHLDPDAVITIDDQVPKTGGNSIDLKEGEEVRVLDLLYSMMTESANDSAVALARAISGSVPEFAALMNEKALQYGAENTTFVNPHGLHDPLHVSTARDLALMAKGCMENEMFRMLASTVSYEMPATNKSGPRSFKSTNRLLWDEQESSSIYVNGVLRYCKYPAAVGVKTGYTSNALGCLVSAATKDGTTLLSVVLKSSDLGRFADSIALLDWGFENYKTVNVLSSGEELGTVSVRRGSVNKVVAIAHRQVASTVPVEASESVLSTEVRLDPFVRAPVEAGQKIGEIELLESGTRIAVFPAVAAAGVDVGGILSVFGIEDHTAGLIGKAALILSVGLILLTVIYIIYKRRQIRRKKLERARRLREKQAREETRRLEWEQQYEKRYRDSRYD
ncbi:MAG: D-alanyl-D-alanine carboxypeptidase family protein [Bacillota bacterium]|nr:D-alanyl-D-alanine carboxypeptidase family protein [Bacillota bacterium]